jgi:hypothetical protein
MARKKDSLADLLILLPWWVSAILAGVAYYFLKFIAPTLHPQNMMFQMFTKAAPGIAPIAAIVLLACAAISAIRSFATRRTLEPERRD